MKSLLVWLVLHMKNKFKYLVKYSLKKKIDTKWFKIVNVLLLVLIVFLVNMDYLINLFGGDFEEKEKIYVVDHVDSFDTFSSYFNALAAEMGSEEYEIILDQDILNDEEKIKEEVVVVLNPSNTEYLSGEIVSYDTVSRTTYEMIVSTMNAVKSELVLSTSGLTPEEITALSSPVEVTERVLNEESQNNETKQNVGSIVTTILIVPFFILIVTMVQMLGAEINDEKTSRGMEIIISSVPAKIHFISKVVAAISYVLIQGILLLIYSGIAMLLRNVLASTTASTASSGMFSEVITMLSDAGIFSLLAKGSIVLIILFLASFIAYAITAAILASMTTNIEDFQQLQTPLMIIMLVGYYVALMAVMFDGSVFIQILGFIPLLSVMIAPTLYLIGEMSLLALTVSTLLTVVVTYFLYKYGLRIYKVGILNYSSSKLWRKMFKSLGNKE